MPGGGAGGADASRLQNALGMTSLGFSARVNGSSIHAVADDFTVPASGWNISRITVFAYQTDSPPTSTLTDLRLLIFNGPPDLPTSAMVYGNPAANVLASTGFTNVYRDSQQNPGLTRRPIMSAVANVNVFLPGGTYWLVWGLAGQLSDGPWIPPVTIPGQATTGNGLQLCTCSGWGPALDGGSNTRQAFPFVIDGTVAGAAGLDVRQPVGRRQHLDPPRRQPSGHLRDARRQRTDALRRLRAHRRPGRRRVLGDARWTGPGRGALRPRITAVPMSGRCSIWRCPRCRSAPTAYAPT